MLLSSLGVPETTIIHPGDAENIQNPKSLDAKPHHLEEEQQNRGGGITILALGRTVWWDSDTRSIAARTALYDKIDD